MNYSDFRSHLGRAKMTNIEFAELVGLNSKSITNYAKDDHVPVHWSIVALLMGEMAGHGVEFKHLIEKLNIPKNKVRGAAAKGRWGGTKQEDIFTDGNKRIGTQKENNNKAQRARSRT